ncbi:MAG: hypothetical protein WBQ34_07625 [Candidatus Acidiferrales bacterium]
MTTRPTQPQGQLRDTPSLALSGRALAETDIEWIAAQSPEARGRIKRLFRLRLLGRMVDQRRYGARATNKKKEEDSRRLWRAARDRISRKGGEL